MKNCKLCGYQFSPIAQRYYCCDKSQPVCSICRRKACEKCKRPRTLQIQTPKCDKCYSRLYQKDLLFQHNCQRYFCSKCLSSTFNSVYQRVAVLNNYPQKDQQLLVKLYCGDGYPYEQLLQFFQHFCIECGKQYRQVLDYQLNDGAKLCLYCFKYSQAKYKSVFIRCTGCNSLLQNSSKAQIQDNQGMILCKFCVHQSQIEERSIQNRKVNQSRSKGNVTGEPKGPFKQDYMGKEQKISEKKRLQQATEKIHQQVKKAQQQIKSSEEQVSKPRSPLIKFVKKPSIKELKEKESQRPKPNNKDPSNSFSVTSKFSYQMQDIDDQLTEQLGLPKNIKMKKLLSNQTHVQQFQIQVPQNKAHKFIECRKCNAKVSNEIAYDLRQNTDQSKSRLVQFSSLAGGLKLENQKSYLVCRVCYYKSQERQKSLLSTKISISQSKGKSSMKRPLKIDESSTSMNYLKVDHTGRRQNRSPSPSPNKEYSLTGSKHSSNQKDVKIYLSQNTQKSKAEQTIEDESHLGKTQPQIGTPPSYIASHPSHHQVLSCNLCGDSRKNLIATIKQGYVCHDCYYRKSPHSPYTKY